MVLMQWDTLGISKGQTIDVPDNRKKVRKISTELPMLQLVIKAVEVMAEVDGNQNGLKYSSGRSRNMISLRKT